MAKWRECSDERGQETIKGTGLKKGEQIEKHNEGRTENTRKCNLQRTEHQSLEEMGGEAARKWRRMEENPGSYSRIFVLTFSDD